MAFSRPIAEPIVLVDGAVEPRLKVQSVHRSIGGHRLDSAVISYDLVTSGDLLSEVELHTEFTGHQLEIVIETQDGLTLVVHWGKMGQLRPVINDRQIELTLVSRVENYHFGIPILAMDVKERDILYSIDEDLIFNPSVDGRTIPNRSTLTRDSEPLFLDWGASRTPASLEWRGEASDAPKSWTLATAALYLMWHCNTPETYIKNWQGSVEDLEFVLDFTEIKDHRIPRGIFLPQALDRLLEPYGFYWYLEYTNIGTRQIKFAKRGDPAALSVFAGLQKFGETLDTDLTNCESIDLQYDVARNLANEIRVDGDFEYVEATFELYRAWSEDHDLLEEDVLDRDSEDYLSNAAYQRVWRDWVLNEAGDYIGLRAEINQPYDFSELFGTATDEPITATARRRRFYPTITRRKSQAGEGDDTPAGEVQGVRVEWSDDGGTNWYDTSERDIQVLEKECGIRFNGQVPPAFLMHAATNAKVRVTATVRSDQRMFALGLGADNSVNPDHAFLVLDKQDGFHFRHVHSSSSYAEAVADGTLTADVVDDYEALQEYTDQLVEIWNRAECSGQITLTGIDWSGYELGNAVPSIQGRNIGLVTSKSTPRYPQIVAIDYNVRQQTMTLTLDSLRENREPPVKDRGRGRWRP